MAAHICLMQICGSKKNQIIINIIKVTESISLWPWVFIGILLFNQPLYTSAVDFSQRRPDIFFYLVLYWNKLLEGKG